jgi:hypothetical protein
MEVIKERNAHLEGLLEEHVHLLLEVSNGLVNLRDTSDP